MSLVIICCGLAGDEGKQGPVGRYLAAYDPEASGGLGADEWTEDLAKAMRFATVAAAHACWTAVPRNRPRRFDGKPNRPLTRYTIAVANPEWL